MKKFILLMLMLAGCSTPRIVPKGAAEYVCTSFNAHGTYANYLVVATSAAAATTIAEEINERLEKEGRIPHTGVFCALRDDLI